MKQCPVCNGPLDETNICPICGYDEKNNLKANADDVNIHSKEKVAKTPQRILSLWGILSLFLINSCIVMTIIDICIPGKFISHYVTLGVATAFLIAYTFSGKTGKSVASKQRLATFVLIFLAWLFVLVLYLLQQNYGWIWQYYMPILIGVISIMSLFLCFFKKATITTTLITACFNLFFALGPLITMIIETDHSNVVTGIILGSFTVALLSVTNLLFLKLLDWKMQLTSKFKK